MNNLQTQQEPSVQGLWDWIPTSDFRLPSATIQTTFKTRMQSLLRLYRKPLPESGDGFSSPEKLEYLSTFILDRLVPAVDWKVLAQSLDPVLMPRCDSPDKKFILILNVPHSGSAELLRSWAADHDFKIIDPPPSFDLLKPDDAWLELFNLKGKCWVLPNLERFYLRHESGLFLIRRFFERLFAGELGFGILGCSSWAWAFFRHCLGISAPVSMVAKPFDSWKLAQWLGSLASGSSGRQIRFRQSDTGRLVLSTAPGDSGHPDKDRDAEPFFKDLAAFSYGISGVALSYWRSGLQAEPDTLDLEKTKEQTPSGHSTVWVKPWMNVEKPALPARTGRTHAFVLHSLLLHETLDMDTLATILPVSQNHFGQILYDLSDSGLIDNLDGSFRVSSKGYPVVRSFLKNEGFLTDDFS